MNRRNIVLAAAVAALASIGIFAALAYATPPGDNGLIAYSRYRFIDNPLRMEIWVSKPDGSGRRRITNVGPNYVDHDPAWAPDGSRILFTRCAPHDGRCTIWSVNADGSQAHMVSRACNQKVSAACPDDSSPTYSPDGRFVAFSRYPAPRIAIADSNLRVVRRLFPFGRKADVPDTGPFAWSPNGKRLAFAVNNDNGKRFKPVNGRAIFIIDVDGSGLHRLTPWSVHAGSGDDFDRIDWSPNGTHILFHSVTSVHDSAIPADGDLYTIRTDGTDLRRLTHLPIGTGVQLGSYSPDGSSIVFTTSAGATPGGGPWPDVFVIKADGTRLTQVSTTRNWEGTPDWGPGR